MSKSYKKTPVYKDRNPGGKKRAARKVRRSKNVPKGKGYKKISDSWDISDYRFYDNLGDWIYYEERRLGRTLTEKETKETKVEWEKYYKRK